MKKAKAQFSPQPGPQSAFLSSAADIAIYGGAAGSGKSFALLLDPLYHVESPQFRGVIFRRTVPMLRQSGGLFDVSQEIYPLAGAAVNQTSLLWTFQSGASVQLAGMELEADRLNYQGAQFSFIGWDELTHFTEPQFWYLFSRCRSLSGTRAYMRATCNPDADSFVRTLIDWWIDADSGYPIKERSGKLRWFVREGDSLYWGDSPGELRSQFGPDTQPKCLTFIPAKLQDNRILMEKEPSYLGTLKALPFVDRMQLLEGNWNVRASGGSFFRREWFEIIDTPPDPATIVPGADFGTARPRRKPAATIRTRPRAC